MSYRFRARLDQLEGRDPAQAWLRGQGLAVLLDCARQCQARAPWDWPDSYGQAQEPTGLARLLREARARGPRRQVKGVVETPQG